ncbi:MAG TPA: gliding motility-associated C-terminal domain-containing protein, partial [Bacteroidia bacterium]|nr:gliding motility-associated C-terminal domain-containing protein [Bacteroidia bacterium]
MSQTAFVCSEVGANTEILTVTDVNGNTSTCATTITVEDNIAPNAICQNITVQLDNTGNAGITASQVDNGSMDACGIASLALDITSFNCANVSGNTVTLTVTDVNGNSSTCTATVTIEDNIAPNAICQNVTVQLDNTGNGSITASAVDNGSTDNCAIASLSLSQTAFVCSEVGANTEVLTVTDVNGNTSTCTTTITVEDNIAPNAICQNVTVQLDNTGNATITPSQIDNGSTDACGVASLALDITTFNCANVSGNTVTLTVTDVNGNTSTCTATVTIEDLIAPNAICQNVTVQLDNTGNGSTTASAVNNGSTDNCAIASLSLSQTAFVCAEVGANTEILTVTDVNGNTSTCTTTITVEDNVAPNAICQNVTVQLDNTGNGSTTASAVNNGSTDNCAIASLSLSQTAFVCSEVGANTEILTVTDANGNSSTCTTTITVEDNIAPNAICQNVTVQLDNTGNASITAAQVDNGSTDACGVASLALDVTTFNCTNVSGNTVTLTVTDVNGNTSTCTATVTIEDLVAPNAICQNVTVQLDNTGNGSATASAVDNGSTDNCAIASLSLSQTAFVCAEVGANTEIL